MPTDQFVKSSSSVEVQPSYTAPACAKLIEKRKPNQHTISPDIIRENPWHTRVQVGQKKIKKKKKEGKLLLHCYPSMFQYKTLGEAPPHPLWVSAFCLCQLNSSS